MCKNQTFVILCLSCRIIDRQLLLAISLTISRRVYVYKKSFTWFVKMTGEWKWDCHKMLLLDVSRCLALWDQFWSEDWLHSCQKKCCVQSKQIFGLKMCSRPTMNYNFLGGGAIFYSASQNYMDRRFFEIIQKMKQKSWGEKKN